MRILLIVAAVVEAGAGAALLSSPSTTVELLLGTPLHGPAAMALGRVAGAALLALAVANWLAHFDYQSRAARGVVSAMVLYNLGAVLILGNAGIRAEPAGVALLPAIILHAAMAVWCVVSLRRSPGS